jgi:hypothetical protein
MKCALFFSMNYRALGSQFTAFTLEASKKTCFRDIELRFADNHLYSEKIHGHHALSMKAFMGSSKVVLHSPTNL